MSKIKTILIGTSGFAENIFRKTCSELKSRGFEIIGVITAPDKPVGRKQVLMPCPVKKWALEGNFEVLEPDRIRKPKWVAKIKGLAPDLIVLCAYGQIIPKEILDIPKYKALNIHPSLLPCWRGASPIQSAILNGDKETGVSIMVMDEEMDHGPLLASTKLQIPNSQTYRELENKLADLGAELLIKTLPDWVEGKIKAKPQEHSKATFCKLIKKEDGKIDWHKSAEEIERQIRAFSEWPESYTDFNGKILKIIEADLEIPSDAPSIPLGKTKGEVFLTNSRNLAVRTGKGILILKEIQLAGKKPMSAKDFLNGHPEIIGMIFK